jgi:hypothetical protein
MPKIYRTMQGEQVDIEALFRKHELSQAVGNMNANARGDELGPGGVVVKTREQKAREYYQKKKAIREVEQRQQAQAAAPAPQADKKDLEDPDGTEGTQANE